MKKLIPTFPISLTLLRVNSLKSIFKNLLLRIIVIVVIILTTKEEPPKTIAIASKLWDEVLFNTIKHIKFIIWIIHPLIATCSDFCKAYKSVLESASTKLIHINEKLMNKV